MVIPSFDNAITNPIELFQFNPPFVTRIGTVIFDLVELQVLDSTLQVSKRPIPTGNDVSDNMRYLGKTMILEGQITDQNVNTQGMLNFQVAGPTQGLETWRNKMKELFRLQEKEEILGKIETPIYILEGYALTSVRIQQRNNRTNPEIRLTLEPVDTVESIIQEVDPKMVPKEVKQKEKPKHKKNRQRNQKKADGGQKQLDTKEENRTLLKKLLGALNV